MLVLLLERVGSFVEDLVDLDWWPFESPDLSTIKETTGDRISRACGDSMIKLKGITIKPCGLSPELDLRAISCDAKVCEISPSLV